MLKKINITTLILMLFMTSCIDEEMNVSPNEPGEAKPEWLLTAAQKSMSDEIWDEWNNGRMGMFYAQYFSATAYTEESRYQIREGVNNTFWNRLYSRSLADLNLAATLTENKNQIAIIELNKAYIYHILTDVYGSIPFSQAGQALENPNPVYDSQQAVYTGIVEMIDNAISLIDKDKDSFSSGDIIYGGDIEKWEKFANSLKLRVAIRMSDVDPATAKTVGEQAIAGGLMKSNSDDALFRYLSGAPNNNPQQQNWVADNRQDFSPSETLVEYMLSVSDPRLPKYADPAENSNTYVGLQYGLENAAATAIENTEVSMPSSGVVKDPSAPAIHLAYSEVEFMLAEAAERGWAGAGAASSHYEAAVTASLTYWGVESANIAAYLALVPYSGGAWKDVIGTQKWLALYMQGIQGWLERIRLDFNKPDGSTLFVYPADGSLDDNITKAVMVPQRMTYPSDEYGLNEANLLDAVKTIGTDSKAVKLWWNKF